MKENDAKLLAMLLMNTIYTDIRMIVREELEKSKEELDFLEWAEKTHPGYLNNLKDGYRRYKEKSA